MSEAGYARAIFFVNQDGEVCHPQHVESFEIFPIIRDEFPFTDLLDDLVKRYLKNSIDEEYSTIAEPFINFDPATGSWFEALVSVNYDYDVLTRVENSGIDIIDIQLISLK